MPQDSVLLVGGNIDDREIYGIGLTLYGFCVVTIEDVRGVRPAIEEFQPRVVVFSLELDDPAAWRGLEDLQCGRVLGVPGVVLTASVRPDGANRLRASANGCAAFVAKPCSPDELACVLRAVLSGARGLIILRAAEFASGKEERGGHV